MKPLTYIVYRQDPPIATGRRMNWKMEYDRHGEIEEHTATLVAIGHVIAESEDEAWDKAHGMTRNPALELVKEGKQ